MSDLPLSTWPLWRRQVITLIKREMSRNLLGKKILFMVFFAGIPVLIALLRAATFPPFLETKISITVEELAHFYQYVFIQLMLFIGSAVLFVKLFRGEILERSLHYVYLAPMRRSVLIVGKYLGGLFTMLIFFVPSAIATVILYAVPHGSQYAWTFLSAGGGPGQLIGYVAMVILATIAYGAVFMLAGLRFKNPILPAIGLLIWEMGSPFMPPFLKIFSVVHYIRSVAPVPLSHGPFSFISEPANPVFAVGLVLVGATILMMIAARRARKFEISYTSE